MTDHTAIASKPRLPSGLKTRGRRLWRRVVGDFELTIAELELLDLAARSLDRIAALEDELADAPIIVPGSAGQPRPHPLAAELRSEVLLASRLLAQLGVPASYAGNEWDGLTASERARKAARTRWDGRGGTR